MRGKLFTIFMQIEDHRRDITKFYKLNDILLMAIIAVICGADSWNEINKYCLAKEEWLTKLLDLENGIPSHDTFNRVISTIDSEKLEECFIEWVNTLLQVSQKRDVVNFDGKTSRGAKIHGIKSLTHMVSAWSCGNNLVLGQTKVSEKSNEITAIPKLIKLLNLKNSIITADAMACQIKIVEAIIQAEADYVLAVKNNQPKLYENIIKEFEFQKAIESYKEYELDHGRIETRVCSVINDFQFIDNQDKWKELRAVVKIESTRFFKNREDKEEQKATRYYITSLDATAEEFQNIIRLHWSIENKLHWILDVAFREDESRKRRDNAAQNFSLIKKVGLNILTNDKTLKIGIKGKRLNAGWNNEYLEMLLNL